MERLYKTVILFFVGAAFFQLLSMLRMTSFDKNPENRLWCLGRKRFRGISAAKRPKRKIEFSKILVAWALILTTLCVAISYGLSFTDHDPASDVTVAVASACIAIAVAYQAKSFGEKNSRNKYGVSLNDDDATEQTNEDDDEAVG